MYSISFVPELKGKKQPEHEYLYWQFYERGSKEAVRFGDWKAIRRPMLTGNVVLYNLKDDLAEQNNIAASHPSKVRQAIKYMEDAHVPDERWKIR